MRRTLIAAALIAGLAASPARAEQVMLKQVSQPAAYHPAGHNIDVLGITPGMSPDAVHAILEKQYGAVNTIQENMGLEYRGVAVSTQNYITRMTAQKGSDDIVVWFATPTTGNGVVEVTRQTTYLTTAASPLLSQVRKDLSDQYGAPAFSGPAVGTGEIELMAWSYKGDQPGTCEASSCRADFNDGLTVADMSNYQRAVRRGHDLTIIGMLLAGIDDPNRASSVVTTVSDAATKLHTLDAAIKQMQDGATEKPKPAAKAIAKSSR
jgi:hypothetical protein